MKIATIVAAAALLIAAAPAPQLSDSDFQRLMEAAVSASASVAKLNKVRIMCVQKELEAPLKFSKEAFDQWQSVPHNGVPPMSASKYLRTGNASVDRSINAALSANARVPHQTEVLSVPAPSMSVPPGLAADARYFTSVLFSSKSPRPSECMVEHGPHRPGAPARDLPYVLTLSRPVLANDFAFIDTSFECSGLCGSADLRVFKKRNGKWTQIADRNLWQG
jgi:hypothetical protein